VLWARVLLENMIVTLWITIRVTVKENLDALRLSRLQGHIKVDAVLKFKPNLMKKASYFLGRQK